MPDSTKQSELNSLSATVHRIPFQTKLMGSDPKSIMRRIPVLLFSLSVACSLPSAHAQTPRAASGQPPHVVSTPLTLPVANLSTETIQIREQNKIIREYHASLLDTVYWALTGVFAFTGLLSGFGWWSNFRVYEADKKRLRDELSSQLKEADSSAIIRENAAQRAIETMLEGKIEKAISLLQSEHAENRRETAALRKELNAYIESAALKLKSATDQISKIDRGLAERESELRHVEEYVWDLKSIQANVLMTQGQGIGAAAAAENKFYLDCVLSRMKSTIEQRILLQNIDISQEVINSVKKRLQSAESQSPTDVAELLSLISKIKVKT
jgi:hypothetical protein